MNHLANCRCPIGELEQLAAAWALCIDAINEMLALR